MVKYVLEEDKGIEVFITASKKRKNQGGLEKKVHVVIICSLSIIIHLLYVRFGRQTSMLCANRIVWIITPCRPIYVQRDNVASFFVVCFFLKKKKGKEK